MSNWLEQLERELDERLSAFLRNNPVQNQLFQDQHQQDRAQALQRQRQQLQQNAEQLRGQLLTLVTEVRAWTDRIDRARRAGALDLAQGADTMDRSGEPRPPLLRSGGPIAGAIQTSSVVSTRPG